MCGLEENSTQQVTIDQIMSGVRQTQSLVDAIHRVRERTGNQPVYGCAIYAISDRIISVKTGFFID